MHYTYSMANIERVRQRCQRQNRGTITDLTFAVQIVISYQLKLIKMRAELAGLNQCAVPFLSCAATNLCWYYYTSLSYPKYVNYHRVNSLRYRHDDRKGERKRGSFKEIKHREMNIDTEIEMHAERQKDRKIERKKKIERARVRELQRNNKPDNTFIIPKRHCTVHA